MAPCINSLVDKSIRKIGQFFFIAMIVMQEVNSIGCFVCFSFNGSDPSCEDTFNSTISLHKESTRNDVIDDFSQTMVIRTCALDSGTFTADTEIVRISHCGHFKYRGHHYSGCVQSCDTDGCNGASRMNIHLYVTYIVPTIVIIFAAIHDQREIDPTLVLTTIYRHILIRYKLTIPNTFTTLATRTNEEIRISPPKETS
ncbi:hypothetical protein DINM_022525 [Dirofilaria immitis]|nr:hypothetical protein [Dirofilaria immitis]